MLASGPLDDEAAARLSAQLLTLDAEGEGPVRLELQNFRSDLPAALTVMGILDVMHAPVHGCVSGEISGPAWASSRPARAGSVTRTPSSPWPSQGSKWAGPSPPSPRASSR